MHNSQVYFVGGVSGVGKTSTIKYLKTLLSQDKFDVRDFDERGVPDGGGLEWHNKETLYWLDVSAENTKENKSTVICGFIHPERLREIHNKDIHPESKLFILHASGETIRKRLLGRYPTPESIDEIKRAAGTSLTEFINNNVSFAPTLKSLAEKYGDPIIETDLKSPEDVSREIAEQILAP